MSTTVKTENNADEVKRKTAAGIRRYLEEAGMFLERKAKEEIAKDPIRIDTGLLRNSITYAVAGQPPPISTYQADKPRGKGDELETGTYEGTAPTDKGENAVYIGTNVEYAVYVHEGTKRMAPNRFLKNAIELNKNQLINSFNRIIKEELGKP